MPDIHIERTTRDSTDFGRFIPANTLVVRGNREYHEALAAAIGAEFSSAFIDPALLAPAGKVFVRVGWNNGGNYYFQPYGPGQGEIHWHWHYRDGWNGGAPSRADLNIR